MNIIKKYKDNRVFLLDEIRGFAIICMMVYHACYNLVFMFSMDIPFFMSTGMNITRDIFAGLFIFISGSVCHYSKSNLKRGILCFGLGLILTLFTWIFIKDELIVFGILSLLGSCMILFSLIKPLINKIPNIVGYIVLGLLIFITYNVQNRFLGIEGILKIDLPYSIYSYNIFPLGFTANGFVSSDFFPLLPWMFVFFAGTFFGKSLKQHKLPEFFYTSHFRPLAAVGRNTLIIYLLHQPVIFGIMELIYYLSSK